MGCRTGCWALSDLKTDVQGTVRGLAEERAGATYVLVALVMMVLMGMAGLGFDATIWYKDKRDIQTVADLSVLAGLHAKLAGDDLTQMTATAVTHAERNGFVDGTDGTLTLNNPPLYGTHVGDANYIEVIIDFPRELNFASLFLGDQINISARAVAGTIGTGDNCILALDETMDQALYFNGNANVVSACGIASNSLSNTAIKVHGSAYVEVTSAQAFGDVDADLLDSPGSGKGLYASDPNQSLGVRLADPYADLEVPSVFGCTFGGGNYQNTTMQPGVYCGGVSLKKNITLEAGVYIIYGGDLNMNGNADVVADGPVTFIFTGATAADIGGVNKINGNTEVNLSAPGPDGHAAGPYQGEYAGVLFFQDPDALSSYTHVFNGGADMTFSGAIYAPSAEIHFKGGADTSPGCVQVVARTITFIGNTGFGNSPEACDAQGVAEISQQRARLIE